jgi:hypothetical protein
MCTLLPFLRRPTATSNRHISTAPLRYSNFLPPRIYDGVSKSFQICRLERQLQMVQLSATSCSCIAILWISLVSFAAITLSVASQRVFIVVLVSLSTQSENFWIHPHKCNLSWQKQEGHSRATKWIHTNNIPSCLNERDTYVLWVGRAVRMSKTKKQHGDTEISYKWRRIDLGKQK